ncbi:hypothetical protein [Spirosoma fluminis]
MFNEHYGARYVRSGDWKLVSSSRDSTWQLFNLATDKAETKNLASYHPQKVNQLKTQWQQWASSHQVFPKPDKKS